jgi:hypothetical protein
MATGFFDILEANFPTKHHFYFHVIYYLGLTIHCRGKFLSFHCIKLQLNFYLQLTVLDLFKAIILQVEILNYTNFPVKINVYSRWTSFYQERIKMQVLI